MTQVERMVEEKDLRGGGALPSLRFPFSEAKAAGAAGVLLEAAGGSLKYMHLIKLMYLADREALDRFGRPIVGGRYVSMKYGPVLSGVLDLVRTGGQEWSKTISNHEAYSLALSGVPDLGPLSEREVDLLREAWHLNQELDQWKLVEITHCLPEWKDPGTSATDIAPEDVMRALGKSDEEIEEARQAQTETAYFDALFASQA